MVNISVIIACYNEELHLSETLDALINQVFFGSWEILFADNGSTDRSADIFREYAQRHPGVPMRYLDASARRGKSHALNLALAAARGRVTLFCDADDVPAPGWLAAMAAALERHDFVACRVDLDRLNTGWVRDYRPYDASLTGTGRTSYPPHAPYGGGGTLGFRRTLQAQVGLFDETSARLQDIDASAPICWATGWNSRPRR